MLDLVFSSQNELFDNVKMGEPLGSSDLNQIRFSIKFQTENTSKSDGGDISTKENNNK